jgi:hypothetical protein
VNNENKSYGEQCFIAVYGVGNIEKDSGQKPGEEFRKPEDQTGATNEGNSPEDSPVVKFLPVSEPAKLGSRRLF